VQSLPARIRIGAHTYNAHTYINTCSLSNFEKDQLIPYAVLPSTLYVLVGCHLPITKINEKKKKNVGAHFIIRSFSVCTNSLSYFARSLGHGMTMSLGYYVNRTCDRHVIEPKHAASTLYNLLVNYVPSDCFYLLLCYLDILI
jgi:hypothetical protein